MLLIIIKTKAMKNKSVVKSSEIKGKILDFFQDKEFHFAYEVTRFISENHANLIKNYKNGTRAKSGIRTYILRLEKEGKLICKESLKKGLFKDSKDTLAKCWKLKY